MLTKLLLPQRLLSNAFERKYGADRFLVLEVDPFEPKALKSLGLSEQLENIRCRFHEMLSKPIEFLGRSWLRFHAQQRSRRKGSKDNLKPGTMQYTFIALSGPRLDTLTAVDIIHWALRPNLNAEMSWCKLFSRLDLKMSRTRTLSLQPGEVAFIDDTYATNDPPDTQFNDPDHSFNETFSERTVMNDGCSAAHPWIFEKCQKEFDLDDVPSGAQIRCAGGKGMIF